MRPAYAGRMNAAHLHLILNHAPLYVLMAGIVLLAWGVMRSSPEVRLIARIAFIVAGFAGLAAYFSGKGAEEALEDLPRIFERLIERHEDAATIALVGIMLSGILAAIGIAIDRASDRVKRVAIGALFTVSLVTLAFTGYAANTGGQIRHSEVRSTVSIEQGR